MQSIGRLTVFPSLPARVNRLAELAKNLYWTWTPTVQRLFEDINPGIYESVARNPMRTLLGVRQADLDRVAADLAYLERYDTALGEFDAYMKRDDLWYARTQPQDLGRIAYFSMEFAFHESIQIYSGGLGVLAGDHCKSASDLGLPFAAVGLLFKEGYFHQQLTPEGWQEETYESLDPETLGLELATGPDGKPVKVWVELPWRHVCAQVWRAQVGRIPVYLLDSDCEDNRPEDRRLTSRLYGGNQETRVLQELILGPGGARALRALGFEATAFHMNEGHAAFLGLERARLLIEEQGLSFEEAIEAAAGGGIFTTHTPVPAGNDAFSFDLIDRSLGHYWYGALQVSRDAFLELGRHDQPWGPTFSMTVLALRLSRYHNGVSELHGDVSRNMWNFLWPGAQAEEVPITHVTNGVHTRTFLAPELGVLFDRHLGRGWDDNIPEPSTWQGVNNIPDGDLWGARQVLKTRLIAFARDRLRKQYLRHEAPASKLASVDKALNERALTIGFARRFATYKRATLLFRDIDRLARIVNNPDRPVQFIFAGKAHPADNPGKEFIQAIFRMSQDPRLEGKVVFIEDYDMNVARHLVQGCDIWLNNPRRPLEASGTSGEKASLNGCINFSVLDGWWREAYDGTNGWPIGLEREYRDLTVQDEADVLSLYETLESEIIPLYYSDREGVPEDWLGRVRNAIRTVAPQYSMQRQVQDYVRTLYTPAQERSSKVSANRHEVARQLAAWKAQARHDWGSVRVEARMETPAKLAPGSRIPIVARVYPGLLDPKDIRVEAVIARDPGEHIDGREVLELSSTGDGWAEYRGQAVVPESGTFTVSVRAFPYRASLAYPLEVSLVAYA